MHSTTSAVDFSKETLVVKAEETYDAGFFERAEAEVVKLLKEPQTSVEPILPRLIILRIHIALKVTWELGSVLKWLLIRYR